MKRSLFKDPLCKSRAAFEFLLFCLTAILLYLVPITIHTADISSAAYSALYAERCRVLLETVVCAFSLTVASALVILYESSEDAGKRKM